MFADAKCTYQSNVSCMVSCIHAAQCACRVRITVMFIAIKYKLIAINFCIYWENWG